MVKDETLSLVGVLSEGDGMVDSNVECTTTLEDAIVLKKGKRK